MTDTACRVTHPDLGRCIVTGPHGGPDSPHRYAPRFTHRVVVTRYSEVDTGTTIVTRTKEYPR